MRRRHASLLLALLLALPLVAVAGPAQAAAPAPVVHVASGRCLDVQSASTTAGSPVIVYACNGQRNQLWEATAAGELRVYQGTRCLEVSRSGWSTRVQIATCTGSSAQRFTVGAAGTIRSASTNQCLEAGTGTSTTVSVRSCTGAAAQRWSAGAAADTAPPTPPGGLRATDPTCDGVTLTWTASTDDVAVTAYDLYHDGQHVTSVSGSTLTARVAMTPGTSWGWYVNARDAAGNVSQASATVTVTAPFCEADDEPPSVPTGLTATATGTGVTLRWAASTDDTAVTAYDVFRDGVRVGSVTGSAPNPPATTFTDSGLAAGTTFAYAVAARDAQGNASPRSAEVSVTTGSACSTAVCATTEVTTDRDLPWGLVQLPDGTVLYSQRDVFDVVAMNPDGTGKRSVGRPTGVAGTDGEGGVLGLAVAPTFPADAWLYVYHTTPTDNRVVRIRFDGTALDTTSTQVLVSGIPRNKYHNGGRLRFGPDGMLYVATGDGQIPDAAQDLDSLAGKVLRIRPDGSVPPDNPFGTAVWSYGHRNPQGLAFDSQGRLWEQEFGNSTQDETNLVVKGGNYGWPQCEGTVGSCAGSGLVAPVRTYPVASASCSGIAIVRDVLYIACLRGARMYRAVISGSTLTDVQTYFVGTYGRLRTVEPSLDGGLWLTTSTRGDKDSIAGNSDERVLKVTLGR